jgi:hypothetical protein
VLNAGRLEAGETYEQRISLRAADQTGAYKGRATAITDKLTVRSSQNTVDIVKPQLKLTMNGPEKEFVDRPLTYQMTVENVGDGPALETLVRMETPGNIERMTFAGQEMTQNGNEFAIGRLDPGESRDLSVTFNLSEPREITTKATAAAYCADEPRQQVATLVAPPYGLRSLT